MKNEVIEMKDEQFSGPYLNQAGVVTVKSSDSQTMMRMIEVAMSKPDFDIVKLQQLLEVKERWDAAESKTAFVESMTAFKAEPLEIFKRKEVGYKTKEGDFVGYKHAELSDVTDVVGPAMAKRQLSFRWNIRQESGTISVDCIVTHVRGHSEMVTMVGAPDTSGKKNAIQQVASTITYLQRYTLLAATGMSTKGQDDDAASSAPEVEEKPKAAPTKIGKKGLEAAIESIKKGEFTVEQLRANYILTDDQWTVVNNEVKRG